MEVLEETFLTNLATGAIIGVRQKFARPPLATALSKDHELGFVHWQGGSGLVVAKELRRGNWIAATKLKTRVKIQNRTMRYRAETGCGAQCPRNLDQRFYFTALPAEAAALGSVRAQLNWLAKWIANFVLQERRQDQAQWATAKNEARRKDPARFPYEQPTIDHYENQRAVVFKLLRDEWPRLSKARDKLHASKTAPERLKFRREVWLAYLADYRALFGKSPDVRSEDAEQLWKDETYLALMNEAMNAPGSRVDKRDWELANGWIARSYYRMNEAELANAFAEIFPDLKHKPRGNTLAKRASRIGLHSALKRGRPGKPDNF